MRKSYVVLGVIAVVLASVAFALMANPGLTKGLRQTANVSDQKQIGKTVVVFVRNPYKDDYGLSRIPGYVDNLGGAEIKKVDLAIQLYDRDGNRKELVKYSVADVPAKGRRTFDANAGGIDGTRRAQVTVSAIEVYR